MDALFRILYPIEWVVAWIMVQFHTLYDAIGIDPASGTAWALSIVGLVIVMRILLIPLFFRQIKASRGMQMLAPEMQAIQKKYKGKTDPASREAMSRETMELYRKHGTNPFASCLPILAQSPIFFALFRVLNSLEAIGEGTADPIGPMTQPVAQQAEQSTIWGAQLSDTFLGSDDIHVKIVAAFLIVAMSATTFFTQRQLTMKNMPPAALQGPMAQQQKVLLYVLPLIFAFSGVNFPIGVLIYWTTTNLWSMGQQFYTIRRMPAPGSEAERMMKERRARKNAAKGITADATDAAPVIEGKVRSGQREQPKRKARTGPRPKGAASGAAAGASKAGTSDAADRAKPTVEDKPVVEDKPAIADKPTIAGKPASDGKPRIESKPRTQREQPKRKARRGPQPKGPAGAASKAGVADGADDGPEPDGGKPAPTSKK